MQFESWTAHSILFRALRISLVGEIKESEKRKNDGGADYHLSHGRCTFSIADYAKNF
jgi:hypothetical protein